MCSVRLQFEILWRPGTGLAVVSGDFDISAATEQAVIEFYCGDVTFRAFPYGMINVQSDEGFEHMALCGWTVSH